MEPNSIQELPQEVFEFILSFLSPYSDLKSCRLVSKGWRKSVKDVVKRMQYDFMKSVSEMRIDWYHVTPELGPTITRRYSHSACCHGTSMYVFGGCTSTNTTFNDLWRLDLSTRRWIRPLATGTFPTPKACASMVSYADSLILFGGWTHPSPYPLHQAWRIFNQLHIYNPEDNRWIHVTSAVTPPAMAGHSATVHKDRMVVFGGLQKQNNGRPFASSNDIWVLNLTTKAWKRQETALVMPHPRYGQSQLVIDDNHAVIIGGCGGPNMLFSDVWLLKMTPDPLPWEWSELQIKKSENAAPHLLCHPACKVGDKMVILSRGLQSKAAATTFGGQLLRPTASRTWVPPQEASNPALANEQNRFGSSQGNTDRGDECTNGRKGVFRKSSTATSSEEMPGASSPDNKDKLPEKNSSVGLSMPSGSSPDDSGDLSHKPKHFRNTQFPSIRPHPMKNRQRQLEGLIRMEERIRSLSQRTRTQGNEGGPNAADASAPSKPAQEAKPPSSLRNPLTMYVADLSKVLTEGSITWLPVQNQSPSQGPEEAILYTLVQGRGELIMFGGIHKDLGTSSAAALMRTNVPEVVSNTVHFITAKKWTLFG